MKFVALAATLLAVSAVASAESLRATADKMGRQASVAIAHKDFKKFESTMHQYITSDFKYTDSGNSMNFEKMLAGMKQGLAMINITAASSRLLSFKEHGKSGTTYTTHRVMGTMTGADKKPHTLVAIGNSMDSWVKTGGSWKISLMAWGKQRMTLDGKPFNPMAGPPPTPARGRK